MARDIDTICPATAANCLAVMFWEQPKMLSSDCCSFCNRVSVTNNWLRDTLKMSPSHIWVCIGSQKHLFPLKRIPNWSRSLLLTACEMKVALCSDELPPKPSFRNTHTLLPEDLQCWNTGLKILVNIQGSAASPKGSTLKTKYWAPYCIPTENLSMFDGLKKIRCDGMNSWCQM